MWIFSQVHCRCRDTPSTSMHTQSVDMLHEKDSLELNEQCLIGATLTNAMTISSKKGHFHPLCECNVGIICHTVISPAWPIENRHIFVAYQPAFERSACHKCHVGCGQSMRVTCLTLMPWLRHSPNHLVLAFHFSRSIPISYLSFLTLLASLCPLVSPFCTRLHFSFTSYVHNK